MMNRRKIKVLVVDDHALVRYGIRRLLQEEPDVISVGEAESTAQALKLLREGSWDAVTMDLKMPGQSGLDGLQAVKRAHPDLPLLVVTMYPEEQYAMRTLKAGASGYLHKSCAPDHLVTAVHKVVGGGIYLSNALTVQLAVQQNTKSKEKPHQLFSDREFTVLCEIADGKPLTQIATDSNLSPKTITTYRKRVLSKLGLHSNSDLVRYAIEHDLLN
jgi:DNA-binding NarL/FixJ family response regulator